MVSYTPPPPALSGTHVPLPLAFDPAKLRGLSERLVRSHWEDAYCGAVRALNAVERRLAAILDDPDAPLHVHGALKDEELLCAGSVRLHELYFGSLGGDGRAAPLIERMLSNAFGAFSRWESDFRRTAMSMAGSGWAVLALGPGAELHDYGCRGGVSGPPGSRPLLVIDMCEHAYQRDYGARPARYVQAFMSNVDWDAVSERLVDAMRPAMGEDETWWTTSTPG